MNIFLVGIAGSGKSTLGRSLADHLNYRFIDLDDYIVEQEDKSIEDIFKVKGEMHFRKLEQNAINILTDLKEDIVISTGGGTPCYYNNMEAINANGISIWLDVHSDIIIERLLFQKNNNRPMVQNLNKEELRNFIIKTIDERKQYYTLANIHVSKENIQINDLLDGFYNFTQNIT